MYIIILVMREGEKGSRKHISEYKKGSVSEKTRSQNPSVGHREQPLSAVPSRAMKSLGRKYVQENPFKEKPKQLHEVIISDELVRNSKQYRMLRQKMQLGEHLFSKQMGILTKTRDSLKDDIASKRALAHTRKLALWEIKNQILELKGILNDQQEQTKRLEMELEGEEPYEEDVRDQERELMEQRQNEIKMQEQNQDISLPDCRQFEKQPSIYNASEIHLMELKLKSLMELKLKNDLNPQSPLKKEMEPAQ